MYIFTKRKIELPKGGYNVQKPCKTQVKRAFFTVKKTLYFWKIYGIIHYNLWNSFCRQQQAVCRPFQEKRFPHGIKWRIQVKLKQRQKIIDI